MNRLRSLFRPSPPKNVSARGSAPIETVALITLLLLPIGPAVLLYEQLSNQLAAESIARHAVRAAVLNAMVTVMPSLRDAHVSQLDEPLS